MELQAYDFEQIALLVVTVSQICLTAYQRWLDTRYSALASSGQLDRVFHITLLMISLCSLVAHASFLAMNQTEFYTVFLNIGDAFFDLRSLICLRVLFETGRTTMQLVRSSSHHKMMAHDSSYSLF